MEFIEFVISAPFICLGWLIIGAIAGAVARQITGAGNRSFINDIILGLIGAFVGGILAGIVGLGPGEDAGGIGLVIANLIIAIIGASVLIVGWRAITSR